MLRVQQIDSLDLPELEPYRTMRRSQEHERRGFVVVEGEKVVRRLLATPLTVISLLITEEWLGVLRPQLEARPECVHAYVGKKDLLENMVGFQLYHGVLALTQIPKSPSLDEALACSEQPHLLVAADGIASAENMGVLVRNAAAFSVSALIVGETCASPWLRRAVRNSMGGIFHLPVINAVDLAECLRDLARRGTATIAAHPAAHAQKLSQSNLARDCCLVFGSEGHGLSQPVLDACGEHVAVPMPKHVDSLNVSNAAAVFLYEAARQRGRG